MSDNFFSISASPSSTKNYVNKSINNLSGDDILSENLKNDNKTKLKLNFNYGKEFECGDNCGYDSEFSLKDEKTKIRVNRDLIQLKLLKRRKAKEQYLESIQKEIDDSYSINNKSVDEINSDCVTTHNPHNNFGVNKKDFKRRVFHSQPNTDGDHVKNLKGKRFLLVKDAEEKTGDFCGGNSGEDSEKNGNYREFCGKESCCVSAEQKINVEKEIIFELKGRILNLAEENKVLKSKLGQMKLYIDDREMRYKKEIDEAVEKKQKENEALKQQIEDLSLKLNDFSSSYNQLLKEKGKMQEKFAAEKANYDKNLNELKSTNKRLFQDIKNNDKRLKLLLEENNEKLTNIYETQIKNYKDLIIKGENDKMVLLKKYEDKIKYLNVVLNKYKNDLNKSMKLNQNIKNLTMTDNVSILNYSTKRNKKLISNKRASKLKNSLKKNKSALDLKTRFSTKKLFSMNKTFNNKTQSTNKKNIISISSANSKRKSSTNLSHYVNNLIYSAKTNNLNNNSLRYKNSFNNSVYLENKENLNGNDINSADKTCEYENNEYSEEESKNCGSNIDEINDAIFNLERNIAFLELKYNNLVEKLSTPPKTIEQLNELKSNVRVVFGKLEHEKKMLEIYRRKQQQLIQEENN